MQKRMLQLLCLVSVVGSLAGCGYGSVATVGDKVVVGRNDKFLFGALRHMYVCKGSDKGLSGCNEMDAP